MNQASDRPKTETLRQLDLHDAIRQRAEEIYRRNGCIPGRDLENWELAEKEIRRQFATRHAVVIQVNGVRYIGEYDPASSDGYTPGEFKSGADVPVRFSHDKMIVTRPDGHELETSIVHRTAE